MGIEKKKTEKRNKALTCLGLDPQNSSVHKTLAHRLVRAGRPTTSQPGLVCLRITLWLTAEPSHVSFPCLCSEVTSCGYNNHSLVVTRVWDSVVSSISIVSQQIHRESWVASLARDPQSRRHRPPLLCIMKAWESLFLPHPAMLHSSHYRIESAEGRHRGTCMRERAGGWPRNSTESPQPRSVLPSWSFACGAVLTKTSEVAR